MTTPVVPTSFSTERADLYDALGDLIDAFMASVPDVVRKHWTALPRTLAGEKPFLYIGPVDEAIVHDFQTRITTFTGFIGYVDTDVDPQESQARVNAFADYMRDLFTANPRLVDNTELRQTGFTQAYRDEGGAYVTDPHVNFEYVRQVGRE